MITFIHDNKAFSLGPKTTIVDNPFLYNLDETAIVADNRNNDKSNNKYKSKLLNIDGVVHSLKETPTTTTTTSSVKTRLGEGGFLSLHCKNNNYK